MSKKRKSLYSNEIFIRMFRKAADLRNEMLEYEFTDNAGAIHSAERIVNIMGLKLNYSEIGHINNLRKYEKAEFSEAALKAYRNGSKVLIEHVAPLRDLTRKTIAEHDAGATDEELIKFIKDHFRLVLLTEEETLRLNKINRSKMTPDRLGEAGIEMAKRSSSKRR